MGIDQSRCGQNSHVGRTQDSFEVVCCKGGAEKNEKNGQCRGGYDECQGEREESRLHLNVSFKTRGLLNGKTALYQ